MQVNHWSSNTIFFHLHAAGATCSNLSTLEYRKPEVASLSRRSNDQAQGFVNTSIGKWPTCPLWKYHKYHNSSCKCGSRINNVVYCKDNQLTVSIVPCYCMSYSDSGDDVVVGACPFLCGNYFYTNINADTNLSTLCNRHIHQNRQGQLCGRCKDNHSPSPYSCQLKCAHCSHYKYNWHKYLAMAYGPLTVFFFMVIIFRLNALSATMNGIIFFSQIASSPAVTVVNMISTYAYVSDEHPVDNDINLLSLAGIVAIHLRIPLRIWNLDFFRMFYQPYCLHPNLSIIQVMCLDYAVAMYPLLMIVLTYLLLKLHERFEVVQLPFKPILWLFTQCHFNYQWNASTSLIEAFATFILLSYVKVINTSFDILMPTQLYNVSGQAVGLYVYYNDSLEYLGHGHLPYALIAISMFITFNLMSLLLLCLYPCRCFQSCLNCCRFNRQVLRTFMDAFQGCYKFDPYDCRYWAALSTCLKNSCSCYLCIYTRCLLCSCVWNNFYPNNNIDSYRQTL